MNLLHIGQVELGLKPEVVLSVGDYSPEFEKAYEKGASILEMRIDYFSQTDLTFVNRQLLQYKSLGLPLIATIRHEKEKGHWRGDEETRKNLFLSILDHVDAIDIEMEAREINALVAAACKKAQKTLIVSGHFFSQTPSNERLESLMVEAQNLKADIVKIAGLAQQPADVVRLLEFVQAHKEKGMIGISMGPLGSISRVVGSLFGSLLTYTSMEPTLGQVPFTDLVHMSRILYPAFDKWMVSRSLTNKA